MRFFNAFNESKITLNKDEMLAFQASKRGGELKLRFDNNYPERVFIGGQTVRILNGQINI